MDELDLGVDIDRDLDVGDRCLLAWNRTAARQRWTTSFAGLSLNTFLLIERQPYLLFMIRTLLTFEP